ncbi:MAG: hypothetical protein EBS86_17585, partial [Crocinitomicaceae bacterium]|nr:hypothetical protein [Crocinitomicaceae bacterium]
MAAQISFGQYNIPAWPGVAISNNTQAGYIGIGTKSTTTATNTPLPNFNLQLHGTADYIEDDALAGMVQDNSNPKPISGNEKTLVNYGKTTRLGLTNTTTGMLSTDGVVLRMSGNNFTLSNREAGNIALNVPTIGMVFNNASSRIEVGSVGGIPTSESAKFNVATGTNNNGLYIYNSGSGNYGLSVRTITNSNDAIQVNGTVTILGVTSPIKNFSVKGTGEVISGNQTINSPSNTNALTV